MRGTTLTRENVLDVSVLVAVTVYALVQLSIHDRPRYDRYAAQFMAVLSQFGGRLLAADESPVVLAGPWPHEKVVLLEFPDRAEYPPWTTTPASSPSAAAMW